MASRPVGSALSFLIVLALCCWHLDRAHNDNTVSRALAVRALAEHGTLEITVHHELTGDKAVTNGHYFSDKAPLPTYAVAAIWALLERTHIVAPSDATVDDRILLLGGFPCGSLPLALIILLIARRLRAMHVEQAWLLAALPILGSFLFVYSGTFYNHLPAAAFGLIAAIAMTKRRPWIAGICAGAAVACDASMLFVVAVWLVQALVRKEGLWAFVIGLVPGAAITMMNNAIVTGSPFTFPSAHAVNYGIMRTGYGFGTWQPDAFLGLTVSPYRGLLFYCPALIAVIALAWKRRRDLVQRHLLLDPFILPSIILVLLFMTHGTWWGGWTYGPRYLTAVPVLLLYRALPNIAASKQLTRATLWLSTFGLVCAVAAKTTAGYSLPTTMANPMVDMVLHRALHKQFDGDQWPVALGFSPVIASAFFVIALIFALRALHRPTATT